MSNNLLFASGRIIEKPVQAILHYEGETYIFQPGDPQYDALIEASYVTLLFENGFMEMGWAEERFAQVKAEGDAVELIYAQPVKVPGARFDMGDTYRLFFPLDVFGFEGEVVFRGGDSQYWGNPLRVDTLDRIRGTVNQIVADNQL